MLEVKITVTSWQTVTKTVVKCRGFTLNWAASHKINFDSMKALILGEGPQEIVIDENGIVRNMDTLTIHNRPMKKTYRKVFNKRILDTNYDSYPHGYIKTNRLKVEPFLFTFFFSWCLHYRNQGAGDYM